MMRWPILILLALLLAPLSAGAVSSDWIEEEAVSARIIAGNYDSAGAAVGLHLKLRGHWKTYWRTPGDGGVAPAFGWDYSENLEKAEVLWPAPERFIAFETVETYGYTGEIVLPIVVTAEDPAKPLRIQAQVNYSVCDEICAFLNQQFTLEIPPGHMDAEAQSFIERFRARVPGESSAPGLSVSRLMMDQRELEITFISAAESFNAPDLFVEVSPDFRFPKPAVLLSDDKRQATFRIAYEKLLETADPSGAPATLTLADGESHILERKVTLPEISSLRIGKRQLAFILFSAFLGGLILNAMPCVLPVLALKLLGIVKHGGGSGGQVRFSFMMSAAGIIASFLALAALVIAFKTAGHAVGWGFQFQEPSFLVAMVVILTLFTASQWGWLEIPLPSWLGGSLQGQLEDARHTPLGNFLAGAFATLLATPCSAPFLGTAISFALARGAQEIFLIFTVMGLGLASPYLLFTIFPKLATSMPKPGAWMVKIKYLLGFLLIATASWLIWVLSHQAGQKFAAAMAALVLSMLACLWIHAKSKALAVRALLKLLILAGIAASFALAQAPAWNAQDQEKIVPGTIWRPFAPDNIPALVQDGKIVFVDVTADWCLTCKFNKWNVLNGTDVLNALSAENVIAMQADYTNPSQEISDFLKENRRYGIPFNIVYGPGAPRGITLSELLTKEAVLDALQKAK